MDENFYMPCNIRGIYSSKIEMGTIFENIDRDAYTAICSTSIIDNLSFSPNELFIEVKPNKIAKTNSIMFFDFLSSCIKTHDFEYDFSFIQNNTIVNSLNLITNNGFVLFCNKYYFFFYIFGAIIFILYVLVSFKLFKKMRISVLTIMCTLVGITILLLIVHTIPPLQYVFPTGNAIYLLSGLDVCIFMLFMFYLDKKRYLENRELGYNYLEVNI